MSILIRLFVAHFLGDFLLQPLKWVKHKQKYKVKSKYLYFHILVHGVLVYVVVGEWTKFLLPVIVMIIHYLIDVLKVYQKRNIFWFLFDQGLHVVSVFVIWLLFYKQGSTMLYELTELVSTTKFWLIILAYIFILHPTAIIIYNLTNKWEDEIGKTEGKGLKNAGKWIGKLERVLVLTFILTSNFSAVGFLLAAKSIFRFGDLTQKKDRKLTEYVLIGTLLSFGITIIIGLLLVKNIEL
ncbi:hypothetical protein LPB138_04765 [Urechidicola croceus]|uniref:DUF3307 domain-containing protein n=1 Tax=Urechidicola croceus TaxID=1850246 RepID=A0A1D8PBY7_9FLAO|nr:hypothetical protein LPB138_04765 [Urechidicola croceus]